MQYTITAIDSNNINEWEGPHGTVFYIPVTLEGHDKIVSMGKKTRDALKVGDTVNGTIIPTDKSEDKWKADPFVSGATSSGRPAKRTYGAIQADRGDGMRQGMCFNNAASYLQTSIQGAVMEASEWADMVYKYASALYAKGDLKADTVEQVKAVFGDDK